MPDPMSIWNSFTNAPASTPAASSGYTSFYDQQKQNFQNPYNRLGLGTTGQPAATTLPGQATQQNLSTAPDLTSLTNLVNQLNLQGQQTANLGRIPGEAGLEAQSSGNIASLLGGNIPQDVVTQLQQQAAERGVAMGSPGSDASNSALLRSLGLTSLDLQGLGQQQFSAATARNPVAPIFDPSKMFLTPAQLGELQTQNAFLGLDWYKALTGQGGIGGGSRGGNQNFGGAPIPGGMGNTGDQTGSNWFSNLMGGTPSSSSVTPGSISVPGYPSQLDTISNPVLDYSGGGGAGLESYDPFQQYSDESFYNTATGG